MIGAIIGDLAAWTWEHDRETFYHNLVSKDAKLSECGLSMFLFSNAMLSRKEYTWRNLCADFRLYSSNRVYDEAIEVCTDWKDFFVSDMNIIPYSMKNILCAAGIITSGWTKECRINALDWVNKFHGGKQECYGTFLAEVINRLRLGYTKKEALKDIPVMDSWKSDNRKEFLSVVCFALRCFERSWDFTSAIHNAMQSTEDKHLAGMLVGGIAEAMYGCERLMIKQKYTKDLCSNAITIPTIIQTLFTDKLQSIKHYEKSLQVFYPKNNALTNVERHHWKAVKNPFSHIVLTKEQRDRILLSAPTDWDCRFGLYLDDGWVYSYRSGVLIGRFQLKEYDEIWRLDNLQLGERDYKDLCMAMSCAINEGCGISLLGETTENIRALKYYNGELEMPKELKNTTAGKFWHGEMMFIQGHLDMDCWKQSAESCLKKLTGERKKTFSKYTPKQRAIIIYIETLFEKWCPCDNLDWIYRY